MAKKKDRGYEIAVSGVKGIVRILIYIFLAIILILIATKAFSLGYAAFNEKPVDKGAGRKVIVDVRDNMSAYDIGRMLKAEGVISENPDVFWFQELISGYHNELLPGTYALTTAMVSDDIFPILAQDDEEAAAKQEKFGIVQSTSQEEETAEE